MNTQAYYPMTVRDLLVISSNEASTRAFLKFLRASGYCVDLGNDAIIYGPCVPAPEVRTVFTLRERTQEATQCSRQYRSRGDVYANWTLVDLWPDGRIDVAICPGVMEDRNRVCHWPQGDKQRLTELWQDLSTEASGKTGQQKDF